VISFGALPRVSFNFGRVLMGVYDRDYVFGGGGGGARPRTMSVTTWVIIANVAAFVLQMMSKPSRPIGDLFLDMDTVTRFGHFSIFKVTLDGGLEFWRFVTFQFVHADLFHLAFNMFALYMFGNMVEGRLGTRKYLAFYLTCGIAGALTYLVLGLVGERFSGFPGSLQVSRYTPLIGASGGVFGVLIACAKIAPDTIVQLLIPPIPVKLKHFAYGYVALAVVLILVRSKNAGGEAAHLGGAAAGYFFIRHSHLLRDFWDVFSDSRKPKKKDGPPLRIVRDDDAELDGLLDRVKQVGHANLTAREKDRLAELTRRKRAADGEK
jgi:membrane associated rhomboid family serine protease